MLYKIADKTKWSELFWFWNSESKEHDNHQKLIRNIPNVPGYLLVLRISFWFQYGKVQLNKTNNGVFCNNFHPNSIFRLPSNLLKNAQSTVQLHSLRKVLKIVQSGPNFSNNRYLFFVWTKSDPKKTTGKFGELSWISSDFP